VGLAELRELHAVSDVIVGVLSLTTAIDIAAARGAVVSRIH
jgi:hypothetical protein